MPRSPIVFDCDGVLIDSESLSWEAWRRTGELFEVEISDSDAVRLTGHTAHDVYTAIADRGRIHQSGISEDDFLASVNAMTLTLFDERLETFEDGEDSVEHLHGLGWPLAVASSSYAQRLALSLDRTGLTRFFDVTVSGDEVKKGKPAPDIYLLAAERLGVAASKCIAVEDSPAGISAAKAAGMKVVAVNRGSFEAEQIAHADVVVPRLTPAVFFG